MLAQLEKPDVRIDDLLKLMVAASRMLVVLADLPQFKGASVGISEWMALTILRGANGISNKQLAARLGVSRQRAHQVIRALEKAQLVEIRTSSADSRENELRVTAEGIRQLEKVGHELAALIETGFGSKFGIVARTQRGLVRVTKVLKAAKSARAKNFESLQPQVEGRRASANSEGGSAAVVLAGEHGNATGAGYEQK
jgi:DNA-binding MarR family transcriptional regulator